jgi:hypothetical protein
VSCFRPAFSAEVIAPVLGGRTALMVTGALLAGLVAAVLVAPPPVLTLLLELEPPPEEQPATITATARAATGTDARKGLLCIETSPPGENRFVSF